VLQPARHLLGRGQYERVAAGGGRLDGAEYPVGNLRELAQLGEVPAHQRQVVPVVELADRPDPGDAVGAAELAAERVAGIRGIGDHAVGADNVGDRGEQARLRIVRVDVEVTGHVTSVVAMVAALFC
jgi:hypothetical protein